MHMPETLKLENFSVVLVNPENSGNIGSISRVMKNFGFRHLIIVDPQEDPCSKYAQGFAMKARDILKSATIVRSSGNSLEKTYKSLKNVFSDFDVVIGTSAKGFSYKNLKFEHGCFC